MLLSSTEFISSFILLLVLYMCLLLTISVQGISYSYCCIIIAIEYFDNLSNLHLK